MARRIALVLALLAGMLGLAAAPAPAANLGVKSLTGPLNPTVRPTVYSVPMGSWQTAHFGATDTHSNPPWPEPDHCDVAYKLGNLGGSGFGQVGDSTACAAVYVFLIVLLPNGSTKGYPTNGYCTWSSQPGSVTGCVMLAEGDIWAQSPGPSSIVSVVMKATTASGLHFQRTFTPLPA